MTDPAEDQTTDEEDNVPDVDHQRCVHSHLVAASCSACLQSCPQSAWIIDDDVLGIDVELCDGCAICVAACPQGAVRQDQPSALIAAEHPETAFMACEIAVPGKGRGVRACLNAVGLNELADLYTEGMRRAVICRGDCAACERGVTDGGFDAAWRGLSQLIDDRGLAAVALEELAPAHWCEQQERFARPSRRGFLMAFRPPETHTSRQRAPGDKRRTAAEILSHDLPDGAMLTPSTPQINTEYCTACDACSRICPHGAISLETAHDGPDAYLITPTRCTGCRMCIDVCDADAVEILSWQRSSRNRVPVDTHQCTSCGNVFRNISNGRERPQLCAICTSTRHNAKLYQVLE